MHPGISSIIISRRKTVKTSGCTMVKGKSMAHKLVGLFTIILLSLSPHVSARQASAQRPTKAPPTMPPPAEQDQTIKISTDLVEVRAVVTDRQGQIVNGLKQEDFQLLENGKPQAISFFSIARIA